MSLKMHQQSNSEVQYQGQRHKAHLAASSTLLKTEVNTPVLGRQSNAKGQRDDVPYLQAFP